MSDHSGSYMHTASKTAIAFPANTPKRELTNQRKLSHNKVAVIVSNRQILPIFLSLLPGFLLQPLL